MKITKLQIITCLPIIYMAVTIFLLRSHVQYFYLSSLTMIAVILLLASRIRLTKHQTLALFFIVLSSIGIVAATILTIEKIDLISNPDKVTSCTLNPVVSCSNVVKSKQASAFGFPNPLIGIFGYACLLTAGMTMLAGAEKLKKQWWLILYAGIIFGTVFCLWLIHEGVFEIGKLCLYCMAVWMLTFSLFWKTTAYLISERIINYPRLKFIVKYNKEIILSTILIILVMIFFRWFDYWTGKS